MSQIFKTFSRTRDINIFVLRGVFLEHILSWKAPLLTKKHQWGNVRHTLEEKLWKINVTKPLNENSIIVRYF